jgi:predicted ATPase/DNA-binding SARP family transcriptional activator
VTAVVRIHDLGPMRVDIDGVPRPVGGERLESLLAALVVRLGQPVSADWLAQAVWGSQPAHDPARSLDTLVWRLRRFLEPQRTARTPSSILVTEENGYRLTTPSSAVDSRVLTTSLDGARQAAQQGDFDAVLETSERVLELWRGTPYQGIADNGWLEPARTRLRELQVELRQLRVNALLGTGQPEQAVYELTPLLDEHPLRESLWGQQMLGLYRSGRYSDSLDAYQQARGILRDELGVEPGAELRDLQHQVLTRDPALDADGRWARTPVRPLTRLPQDGGPLIGRDGDAEQLEQLIAAYAEVTVTGPMGCGKTRLAVDVANRASASFTDGVWFVDLSVLRDPERIADAVADAIGLEIPADSPTPDRLAQYLGGRSALLVLDNCEQIAEGAAEIAASLTRAAPELRILATSREPLGMAAEREFRLAPLPLPAGPSAAELQASAAASLLVQRVLDGGRPVDLDGPDAQAVAVICQATDGLPLALELAAARARTFELYEVADSLTRHPGELAAFGGRRSGRQLTLRDSVDWSYQLVSSTEQAVHRRLSVLPGAITLAAATAVCADVALSGHIADALSALVYRSLLERSRPGRSGGATLFRQLEVVRAHAAAALAEAGEEAGAVASRDQWVIDRIHDGPRIGRPGQSDWYDFLDDNHAAVTAMLDAALVAGVSRITTEEALRTVAMLSQYWIDRERSADAHRWLGHGLRIVESGAGGGFGAAVLRAAFGGTLAAEQRMDDATPHILAALPELDRPEERFMREAAETLLELAMRAWTGDDWELSRRTATTAAEHGEMLGDPHVAIASRAVAVAAMALLSHLDQAVAEAESVLSDNAAVGNDVAQFYVYVTQSVAAAHTHSAEDGLAALTKMLHSQFRMGVRNIADTVESRGDHAANAGKHVEAVRCLAASASHNHRLGRAWPRQPRTATHLEQLRAILPAEDFQRAWTSGERLDIGNLPLDWL